MKKTTLLYSLIGLLFFSCESFKQDKYEKQYVVETYLAGDEEFPELILTKTLPLDEVYSLENAGINSANVTIYELDETQKRVDSVIYEKEVLRPGVYIPSRFTFVKPATDYELLIYVTEDNNHTISGKTFVPGQFEALSANSDTVMYQSDDQLSITYTPSYYPNRQSYYILTVIALDTTGALTPFYASVTEDGEPTRAELQRNSSNILTEANFEINPDGNVTIQLPWLAVAFYGDHEIIAATIDENIYDFNRTRETQFGGSTISPGEIYDIIDKIDGGTGIFGSLYRKTNQVFISRNPIIDLLYPPTQ
jgi:hypothetical protein